MMTVRKISVRIKDKKFINSIQFTLSDEIDTTLLAMHGNLKGDVIEWTVPQGQYIVSVEVNSDKMIDALVFITNKGEKSPKLGGNGGKYNMVYLYFNFSIFQPSNLFSNNIKYRLLFQTLVN
jgi:hypothetical protein